MARVLGKRARDPALSGPRVIGDSGAVLPLRPVEAPRHNLPERLTSFVGRQRELGELATALAETRILTLSGAGGCGKSRLALRVAARVLDGFPDGVWWVELASLSDPALVAPALAQVLRVRPLSGQSDLDAAASYLARRRALILVDNCEHLLEEAARVVEALALGCPQVTVLATSREPLGVPGESDWRVPSLSLPGESNGDTLGSDAVRLFVERAAKVRAGFRLNDDNAPAVIRICRELDGIPLAIELAAGRLRLLSVGQIADGLSDRFRLITGGPRTALPRHRTLGASVGWSHDLLAATERALFRRLGVFLGGFTLDAAEHVCAGGELDHGAIFDVFASLVEKSLVQIEECGAEVRYRLLETVRQYALERLEEAGETGHFRDRHRDYFLEVAERIEPGLLTPRQPELLDVLDSEAANLTRAIEWSVESVPEKARRLYVALTFWWRLRVSFREAEATFQRLGTAATADPSVLWARALWVRAYLLTYAGAFDAAFPAVEKALAEAERVGDRPTTARALYLIGTMTMYADPVGCRQTLERARDLAAASGDEFGLVVSEGVLAATYVYQSDHRRVRRLAEEARPLLERMGHQEMWAWYWNYLAVAAHLTGDHDNCREACEKAIAAARSVDDVVTEAMATTTLALAEIDVGDTERAFDRIVAVRERALLRGAAFTLPWVEEAAGLAQAASGRLADACSAFELLIDHGALGAVGILSGAHVKLAETLRLLGAAGRAQAAAERGLELTVQFGNCFLTAQAQLVLGRLAAARQEWAKADRLHHEALAGIVEGGHHSELPRALEGLAGVAAGLESAKEAARFLGAASRLRRELGLVAWKHQRDELEQLATHLRQTLGPEAFEEEFAAGQALSMDEAIAYARRGRDRRRRPARGWESLTPTELEVARHTAAGLSNPEIAERMFIARGTVRIHLSHIFAKLGIKNRAELAALAAHRSATPAD